MSRKSSVSGRKQRTATGSILRVLAISECLLGIMHCHGVLSAASGLRSRSLSQNCGMWSAATARRCSESRRWRTKNE